MVGYATWAVGVTCRLLHLNLSARRLHLINNELFLNLDWSMHDLEWHTPVSQMNLNKLNPELRSRFDLKHRSKSFPLHWRIPRAQWPLTFWKRIGLEQFGVFSELSGKLGIWGWSLSKRHDQEPSAISGQAPEILCAESSRRSWLQHSIILGFITKCPYRTFSSREQVPWFDETVIKLSSLDYQYYFWRKQRSDHHLTLTVPTLKDNLGSRIPWWCLLADVTERLTFLSMLNALV